MKIRIYCHRHNGPVISILDGGALEFRPAETMQYRGAEVVTEWELDESNLYCTGGGGATHEWWITITAPDREYTFVMV